MQHNNSESMVSKFPRSLPKKLRSTIPYWILEKFPREWQAHLETISYYILEQGVWWEETPAGIVFNDVKKTIQLTWYLITIVRGV